MKTGSLGKAGPHAAYIARTGSYEKYLERGEVLEATGFGNMPTWASENPADFWAASDQFERANGTAYREMQIALPRELDAKERLALVESFIAQEIGETHAYQFAIHVPKAADGLDNPHVHLMFSERRNDGVERDPDQYFKRYNPKHPERGGSRKYFGKNPHDRAGRSERAVELKELRSRWEVCANSALEKAGVEVRIDMRSYAERGLAIEPEPKQLPSEWRAGGRENMVAFRAARAAELAAKQEPQAVIDRVSARRSLFTRQDLYRELGSVCDDADRFTQLKVQLDAHPSIVPLEIAGVAGRESGSSRQWLTTRSVLETERSIEALGGSLIEKRSFGVKAQVMDKALAAVPFELSAEQIAAVRAVSDDRRLALVSGVAGAGKSTMLGVAREGYEKAGFRVSGMALAGKAADELSKSSGIESRTIASWLYRVDKGDITLTKKDVVVVDEAGMMNNTTMERVLDAVNQAGAKVILVGDAEQLQPIERGTPFLALSEAHGASEISAVRRQNPAWQREATEQLSRQDGGKALAAYRKAGCVHAGAGESLVPALVANYLGDGREGASADTSVKESKIILAHRKVDVAMLNEAVRDARKERGELSEAVAFGAFGTSGGELELAVGDRVVFTKNDARVGVLNGQFGEVVALAHDRVSVARDDGSTVSFKASEYKNLQHGYASTIHKSQGMTVDRAMVWGSSSLDRHLGYVAMSRHRERLDIYQPDEATKVRTLDACLDRSSRVRGVESVIEEHGLGLSVGEDGQSKLTVQMRSQSEIEAMEAQLSSIRSRVQVELAAERMVLEGAVESARSALAAHEKNKPTAGKWELRFSPGAVARLQSWERNREGLSESVDQTRRVLRRWDEKESTGGRRTFNTIKAQAPGVEQALSEAKAARSELVREREFARLQKTLESKPDAKLQKKVVRELKVLSRQSTSNKTAGSLFDRLKGVIGQKEKDLGIGRSRDRGGLGL